MGLRVRARTALVAAAVVASVAGAAIAARGAPRLPPITADRLVASALAALADPGPISGQLRTHVALGLPNLPAQAGQPDDQTARALEAINGDHRVRLWRSRDGLRLAELLPTAELGLFVSREPGAVEAWAWDSAAFTAYRLGPVPIGSPGPAHPQELLDPAALARLSLESIAPSTRVAVGASIRVAGRDAYRLVIRPRTAGTLVGRVEIAVDAARRVPLGVWVFARRASSAALSVAFDSVSFGHIDPARYRFVPPPGAKVVPLRLATNPDAALSPPSPGSKELEGPAEDLRVFGMAWETVLAFRLPVAAAASSADGLDLRWLFPLSGSLFSARLVDRGDHGWLLFGAVPQARLAALERDLS